MSRVPRPRGTSAPMPSTIVLTWLPSAQCASGLIRPWGGPAGSFRTLPRVREALDVRDQVEDVVLADLSGERRHDRRVTGGHLARGQEDRVADVALVGD